MAGFFGYTPSQSAPQTSKAGPPTGPGAAGISPYQNPGMWGLISAGAAMMDPRATYGNFGASLNRGIQQGLATYAPLKQMQWNQQAAMQQAAAQQHRAQVLAQLQQMSQQPNVSPQQLYSTAMSDPELAKSFALPGLLNLSKPQAPYSSIGKLQADLQAGRITPDQYKQQIAIMNKPLVSMATAQPLPISDLAKLRGAQGQQLPYGTTAQQAMQQGAQVMQQPTSAEAKQMAQTDISNTMLDQLESLVNGKLVDNSGRPLPAPEVGPTRGLYYKAITSPLAGMVPGELKPEEARLLSITSALSTQLLAAMRGAQVGPAEQQRFEEQLPMPGQPRALFDENLRTTRQNLQMLNERQRQYRGMMGGAVNRTPPPRFSVPLP